MFRYAVVNLRKKLCITFPKFAACFRLAIPEARGKPRHADQTPVSDFRDLRFCWCKSDCTRRFSIFPALPDNTTKPSTLRQRHDKEPLGKQPFEQIDLNLPNDKSTFEHELVCKVVATSSNTERTAIVIKEGEYLGHL